MHTKHITSKILLLLLLVLAISGYNTLYAQDFVPEQLHCQVTSFDDINNINQTYGTTLLIYLDELNLYLLQTPPGLDAESLATIIETEPGVIYCQANYIIDNPEGVQSSQPFLDEQTVGDYTNQTAAATLSLETVQTTSTGSSVKVAVIDAGVDMTHPQLSSSVTSGYDYVSDDPTAQDEPGGIGSGHGTFVAGVIKLVAPDAEIVAYRVLDTTGRGDGFSVAEAIYQAVKDSCKVINLSLVMSTAHGSIDLAIDYAHSNNVMVIAAAGNDSLETDLFPAKDSYTLSVAAIDTTNLLADFSNFGGKVDICAPGTQIYSPHLDSMYAWWDGTSFAAPFVAGQAALLYALDPHATWNDIRDAITLTATDLEPLNPGYEGKLGFGLINPEASLASIDPFICGDINNDNTGPDISDMMYLVEYMFNYGPPAPEPEAMDVDGDGFHDVSDLLYFVDYFFLEGPAPVCQ